MTQLFDQSPKKRIEELRQVINFHNYQYHVLDTPLISDYEFDQLMLELDRSKQAILNGLRLIPQASVLEV